MKKSMTRGTMLFASIMVLAACAVPAMASAATWGTQGTNHTMNQFGSFTASVTDPVGSQGFTCTGLSLGTHVRSPASSTLDVTSAANFTCTGTGTMTGCNIAATPTGLPWTAVAVTTSNVQLNVANINLAFTSATIGSCQWAGSWALTGTLASGVWSGPTHSVSYSGASGLRFIIPGSGWTDATLFTGTLKDTIQSLFLV